MNPTSHESKISGLLASHRSKLLAFKKLLCCQATEELQLDVAIEVDLALGAVLADLERRYPVPYELQSVRQ